MMMDFNVVKAVSFDVDDDLAERVLDFVLNDMWDGHPDSENYEALSIEQTDELIITILETALKKYKNEYLTK